MKFSEIKEKLFSFLRHAFFCFCCICGGCLILSSFSSENCFDFLYGFWLIWFSAFLTLADRLEYLEENVDDIKEQLISLNDFFIDGADE